jgi:hypothetical protein
MSAEDDVARLCAAEGLSNNVLMGQDIDDAELLSLVTEGRANMALGDSDNAVSVATLPGAVVVKMAEELLHRRWEDRLKLIERGDDAIEAIVVPFDQDEC